MPEFQLGNLGQDQSPFSVGYPTDTLKVCTDDVTSVFGTLGNSYLTGIPVMAQDENKETPFSYESMMHNIFTEDFPLEEYDMEDDYEEVPNLTFEC